MSWKHNLGLDRPPTIKRKSGIWVTTYEALYEPLSPPWLVTSRLQFDENMDLGKAKQTTSAAEPYCSHEIQKRYKRYH
jgi:hypothetical protein